MSEYSVAILIEDLEPEQIAEFCDHTFLLRSESYKQSAGEGESSVSLRKKAFRSFMDETVADEERLPYAVCVRPEDVAATAHYLEEHGQGGILIASVVGFPDGSLYGTDFKIAETILAIDNGAKEIDMVLNYARLTSGDINYVRDEVTGVVSAAHERGALTKLILETSELNSDGIKEACGLAHETGVDFVKTSTGFSAYGARAEDLEIMRAHFSGGIKISGGVTPENVRALLYAASERKDGFIELNPHKLRIGESSLLSKL